MEYGAHLPLITFRGERRSLADLLEFTETARDEGYAYLCANDHLVFSRPWLDGPTALASVLARSGSMQIATTLCLPVVRGPAQTAKMLAALDVLSEGRLVVGLGTGSSARDYALAGLSYEERWSRLEECIAALRAFFRGQDVESPIYGRSDERLEPLPVREGGPPIWLGSWGAGAGLRRTAELADGWLASGYNTDPTRFARNLARIREQLPAHGKDPARFPNAIATLWLYVTENRAEAERMLADVLSPVVRRPAAELHGTLPIGSAEECARILRAYRDAGAERLFVWPLGNEAAQLAAFRRRVVPLIEAG